MLVKDASLSLTSSLNSPIKANERRLGYDSFRGKHSAFFGGLIDDKATVHRHTDAN